MQTTSGLKKIEDLLANLNTRVRAQMQGQMQTCARVLAFVIVPPRARRVHSVIDTTETAK